MFLLIFSYAPSSNLEVVGGSRAAAFIAYSSTLYGQYQIPQLSITSGPTPTQQRPHGPSQLRMADFIQYTYMNYSNSYLY
jgi:hypothetical protein